MGSMKQTIMSITEQIPTEADAYRYLEVLRWGDEPACAHCGDANVYFIAPGNGVSRKTRTGAMSERRVWKCRSCKRQFSVLTGTVFHRAKVPVRMIVLCLFEMCLSKNGVAAREVARKYGTCPRTAWYVTQRIREAMKNDGALSTMRGTIIADETWFGGDPTNRHGGTRRHAIKEPVGRPVVPGENLKTDKQPILTIINRETGEVRSRTVPDVTGHTLRKVIAEQVDTAGSVLWTDEGSWYNQIGREFIDHKTINHSQGEYARNGVSTNQVEAYFGQFKRSVDGTHHHVSKKHLPRYLTEFDFRYTTCKESDGERLGRLARRMDQRLTYRSLTAS